MTKSDDDLGDARSRRENHLHRELMERRKSENPVYAYAPRWIPTRSWRLGVADLIPIVLGAIIIAGVIVMHFLGYY